MSIRIPWWVDSSIATIARHGPFLVVAGCTFAAAALTVWPALGDLNAFLLGAAGGAAATALGAHKLYQRLRAALDASEKRCGELQGRLDGQAATAGAQDDILTRRYRTIPEIGGGDAA